MEPVEFAPGKKNKRGDRCAVPGCTTINNEPNITFHSFPKSSVFANTVDYFGNEKKVNKLEAWKLAIKLENIASCSKICSQHFRKNDNYFPDVPAKTRILKSNAIPSLNLPEKNYKNLQLAICRQNRLLKRTENSFNINHVNNKKSKLKSKKSSVVQEKFLKVSKKIFKIKSADVINETSPSTLNLEIPVVTSVNISEIEEPAKLKTVDMHESTSAIDKTTNLSTVESTVQATNEHVIGESEHLSEYCQNIEMNELSDKPIYESCRMLHNDNFPSECSEDDKYEINGKIKNPEFLKCITTDSELSTATGIENFKILEAIVAAVKLVIGDRYEKKSYVMNTYSRIILTYVKLKQNLSYSFLALLFNCISERHCQRIFCETVQILSKVLYCAISWPEKNEIKRNMPLCFNGFEDTRVVLDCTEVAIEQPKNLCCQIVTYSSYKGRYTCKFLTGVTPAGDISFVSKAYGGRASDSSIFEQSDLMKLLESKDAIMVDRGFFIEEVCKKNKWKIIRPPFVKQKQSLSKADAIHSCRIAKARVHIERSNQRLKVFKILSSVMPTTLVPLAEEIFTLLCATVNLSSVILKADKFPNK